MKKRIEVISSKVNKMIQKIVFEIKDIFKWLRNRKTTQEEMIRDEIQYTTVMAKITKMQHQLEEIQDKLKESQKETEHQRKLKEIYLKNCKRIKRKLQEVSK